MIDYKELPKDGILFEQLVRELFLLEGYETFWTGVGQDDGRDLIVIEKLNGPLSSYTRKWLVSCKHFAHSGKSVGKDEVLNVVDDVKSINAEGFILVCSTQPSSSLVRRLDEIQKYNNILTHIWDGIELENRLSRPHTMKLILDFFPNCSKNYEWKIYNTDSPSFWAANFKGYFFYLSSRTANSFPNLKNVENIIKRIEEVQLPKTENEEYYTGHRLRLRAVYFDDKHSQYKVFVDYLYPQKEKNKVLDSRQVFSILENDNGYATEDDLWWNNTFWDLKYAEAIYWSDHFHEDHKDYYEPYIENYRIGSDREDPRICRYHYS